MDAQRRLGLTPRPIGHLASGARNWPPGFVGSITNKTTTVVLAAAAEHDYRALGIDLERPGGTIPPADVIAPEGLPIAEEAGVLMALAAKEALFKALPPTAQNVIHADLALTWSNAGGIFRAAWSKEPEIAIQVSSVDGWILAAAARRR